MAQRALPPYIALAGPTASGKTALALALAQHMQQQWGVAAEIVSVDSALIYRGMDIGTAKPSAAERAQHPHHLIDILDPADRYSAARFVADAQSCIAHITARGRIPLLVGGTMLYYHALFHGLNDLPAARADVRAHIEQQARQNGWPAMHAQLAALDSATAARLSPHDSQRISRALEVWHLTGQPLSYWYTQAPRQHQATPPALLLSLEPRDRTWLHQRIAQRFDTMLRDGFLDEVATLRQRPDLHPALPAMRCVGYRQAWHALETATPLPQWRDQALAATRQLAKRQITWLRSMPQRCTLACDTPDLDTHAIAHIDRVLPALLADKPRQSPRF